jgi:hypothetical protein
VRKRIPGSCLALLVSPVDRLRDRVCLAAAPSTLLSQVFVH